MGSRPRVVGTLQKVANFPKLPNLPNLPNFPNVAKMENIAGAGRGSISTAADLHSRDSFDSQLPGFEGAPARGPDPVRLREVASR